MKTVSHVSVCDSHVMKTVSHVSVCDENSESYELIM